MPPRRKRQYWLLKSEPETYSFADLRRDGRTLWDGVRNYQARNFMRDGMAPGDGVLFYHSNAKPPGVAGLARVAGPAYPDPTQFDPASHYHDPSSDPDDPRWWLVDVEFWDELPASIPLDVLKRSPALEGLELVRKGSRLSVQPVSRAHWVEILGMVGYRGSARPRD